MRPGGPVATGPGLAASPDCSGSRTDYTFFWPEDDTVIRSQVLASAPGPLLVTHWIRAAVRVGRGIKGKDPLIDGKLINTDWSRVGPDPAWRRCRACFFGGRPVKKAPRVPDTRKPRVPNESKVTASSDLTINELYYRRVPNVYNHPETHMHLQTKPLQ